MAFDICGGNYPIEDFHVIFHCFINYKCHVKIGEIDNIWCCEDWIESSWLLDWCRAYRWNSYSLGKELHIREPFDENFKF